MIKHIEPIRIEDCHITDPLFGERVRLMADCMLPYQWNVLNDRADGEEPTHCAENFRIAAGELSGRHQGAVFQDTDLYKWLEAASYCIEWGCGEKLLSLAEEAAELICRAQEPDGYLNTYVTIETPGKRWTNLAEGHELYSCGHLIEAAVAYFNATGREALLRAAARFADLVDSVFGPEEGKCHGYPGHQEIELALVKLYRVTGRERYLKLARYFIDQRGGKPNYLLDEMARRGGRNVFPEFAEYDDKYAQTHLPPVRQRKAVGHAVRAMYMYSAMADLALEQADPALEEACRALFGNVTKKQMYITGGVGSSGKLERFTTDYDLPNDRMYCESCASVGLMMFGQRMAMLTEDASYFDAVERALCNTVLAGMSKDGDRYFYVNPLEVWPENCLPSTSMSHVQPVRQRWFSTACCPPNIARTLASLGQYIYAKGPKGLYVDLFVSSQMETRLDDTPVQVAVGAGHMHGGTVKITLRGGKADRSLFIRMPWYMREPVFTVNGKRAEPEIQKGYAVFPMGEDVEIVLHADVSARFVAADGRVRADIGKVALMKGPFVYCLEQQDNGKDLPALSVRPDAELTEEPPEPGLPGQLPTLTVKGERLSWMLSEPDALYGEPVFAKKAVTLKAIPYALWCNRTPGEMQVWLRADI